MILVPSLADIEKKSLSPGERSVARLLRDIDADPNAVAFYSVDLRSHAYKQQAEADFVILWRGTVIVIEVKGGGVRKHDGVWYTVDRHGDWHRLATSPMEQARSAGFALRSILKEQGIGWFAHEAVVVTRVGEGKDGKILRDFEKGYAFKGKLIRPSKVEVAQVEEDDAGRE
jgi:hypothetical protein